MRTRDGQVADQRGTPGTPADPADDTAFAWDGAGMLRAVDAPGSSADRSFGYDGLGRLGSAAVGGSSVSYADDALGRLITRTHGGTTETFTDEGVGHTLARRVRGSTTTRSASTPAGPLAERSGQSVLFYLLDPHGDTIGTVAPGATTPASRAYGDPWGALSWSGAAPVLGFRSRYTDPVTGWVATPARWYVPALSRFSCPDPLPGDPELPLSLNRYAYALDDLVSLSDPSGLSALLHQDAGGKPCGRACEGDAESEDPDTPEDPVPVPPTPFREPVFDWVQAGRDAAWSRWVVDQDPLRAFAAFLLGWDCDEGVGCAPVVPGAIGMELYARLGFRGLAHRAHTGWTLDFSLTLRLNRLNPVAGYEVQRFEALVIDARGAPVPPERSRIRTISSADAWTVYGRLTFPLGSGQPRMIRGFAAAYPPEMNRAPIQVWVSVPFDPTPGVPYGPYPP